MRTVLVALVLCGSIGGSARAQESPFSGSDVALTPPCVRVGDEVSCWGAGGGGFALAPVPALRGVRGLVPRGSGVCGVRGGEVVCWPENPNLGARRARTLSHEGQTRCSVDSSGVVECPEGRVASRGRVLSVVSRNVGCGSVYGPRAIILRSDGRVTVDGCNETWHRTLRDIVQMEVSADLFCTRDRAGAVACVDLEGHSHLEPQVLASFDGRTGYTDLAVASRTVCALHATGSVSCASGDPGRADAARSGVRGVYQLPQTGIRDIAFHENALCLLDASGVLCDGLGGDWLGVAVQVSGLPPVRRAAFADGGDGGCAIDRDDALWCWDGREPVRARENVRAVTLMDTTTFTLDSDGTLRAQGRRGSGVSLVGFWPTAPDDLVLRAGTVSQGDATVVCGAAGGESRQEVRCAEVRFRGVRPESLVAIPTPSEEQRAWIRRRHGASELDGSGTWWLNDGRHGLRRRVRLRDDMAWADATPMASVLLGIDRRGALWLSATRLEGRLPAPTGPSGWLRFAP